MLISNASGLRTFCESVRGEPAIYLDTEFIGEESYHPRLEIIQVEAGGKIALVDFPAVDDLRPFWDILSDDSVEKVFHSGQQDLSLLGRASGRAIVHTFDTQIAAAFVGWGEQCSYAELVRAVCGVSLSKSHTYSAWGRRPLSDAQLAYAEDDVRYLPQITERLKADLHRLGREEWAREEFRAQEDCSSAAAAPPQELFERVKGAQSLRPRELAILRELAAWREEEARRRDRPRQSILRDPLLVSIARHAPSGLHDLRDIRSFPSSIAERYGRDLIGAVERGAAVPRDELPRRRERRELTSEMQTTVSILQALARMRASECEIAQGLLARNDDLEELASVGKRADQGDAKVLRGWRWDLVGRDLVRVLKGELLVGVDADTGRPVLHERR